MAFYQVPAAAVQLVLLAKRTKSTSDGLRLMTVKKLLQEINFKKILG
jgi:hypothetical protein